MSRSYEIKERPANLGGGWLIDFVKPDDVIAGITSNGVPVREADTGSSPVNC